MANEEAREAALYTGPVTTTFLEWANPEHMHSSGLPYLTALNEYAQYRRGVAEGIRQAREAMTEEWAGRFYSPGWYAHPEPTEFLGPIRKTREEAEKDRPSRADEGEWRDGVKRRYVTPWFAIDALGEDAR